MGIQDLIDKHVFPASVEPNSDNVAQPYYGKGPYAAFDPEGDGYDYNTAIQAGMGPDETGHWSSREPKSGQILKGRGHHTFDKTIAGEAQAGYAISKGKDGKYYSMEIPQTDPAWKVSDSAPAPVAGLPPATPPAPPGFEPGPSAPVRVQKEDSFWNGVFRVMQDAGTQPGDIPVSTRMKIAQQEANIAVSNNELAWKNYKDNNQLVQSTLRKHARDAQDDVFAQLPNIKAQLSSIIDPELGSKVADSYARAVEGMSPGMGEFVHFFYKNQSSVYAADALLADPDPNVSGPAKEIVGRMGYEKAVMSPQWQAMTQVVGRDVAHSIASRLPLPIREKLVEGKLGEEEFRKAYGDATLEMQMRPVNGMAAKTFLSSPAGQEFMVGIGVKTDAIEIAHQKKMKELGPIDAAKAADFKNIEEQLQHPERYSVAYLNEQKSKREIYLGTKQKESSPGESPNNMFSRELLALTNGQHRLASDLDNMKPGTPEYSSMLTAINTANQRVANYSAQASLKAQMDKPADMAAADQYNLGDLVNKRELNPILTPMSTGEKLTNPKAITIKPAEAAAIEKIKIAKSAGKQLFDLADKAYSATTALGMQAQVAADAGLNFGPTAAAIGMQYPDMKLYHDALNAWAGNNAKALGGEVGVLTDVDITRWVNTFPKGSDAPKVRKLKAKMFDKMVDLVETTKIDILAGKKPKDYVNSKEFRAKVEGTLGSLEGTDRTGQNEVQAEKLSPANKLRDEMLKGKK